MEEIIRRRKRKIKIIRLKVNLPALISPPSDELDIWRCLWCYTEKSSIKDRCSNCGGLASTRLKMKDKRTIYVE